MGGSPAKTEITNEPINSYNISNLSILKSTTFEETKSKYSDCDFFLRHFLHISFFFRLLRNPLRNPLSNPMANEWIDAFKQKMKQIMWGISKNTEEKHHPIALNVMFWRSIGQLICQSIHVSLFCGHICIFGTSHNAAWWFTMHNAQHHCLFLALEA